MFVAACVASYNCNYNGIKLSVNSVTDITLSMSGVLSVVGFSSYILAMFIESCEHQ